MKLLLTTPVEGKTILLRQGKFKGKDVQYATELNYPVQVWELNEALDEITKRKYKGPYTPIVK